MKPGFSVPYGSPQPHSSNSVRHRLSSTFNENHIFEKASSTKALCPDKSIVSDPENIIGTSPKSMLKINEFSSRLLQIDHKHPVKFHSNLSDTFQDNLLSSHQKLSTTCHDSSFNELGKGSLLHNPNTKDTSLKALSLLKMNAVRPEKIFTGKSPSGPHTRTTKCLQELKKLSQPNPVNQASYISRINPVGQIDLFQLGKERDFANNKTIETAGRAWPEEKKAFFTESSTPTGYKGIQINTDMKYYEPALVQRNLNVPRTTTRMDHGVNIFKCEKKEVRESVNSPLKNTGEDSPTQCQDSPIRVNIVRALENKTKGNNDMKNFSIFGMQENKRKEAQRQQQEKTEYAPKLNEIKLIPIVEIEKKDTDVPEDVQMEPTEKKESHIKALNIISRRPDCAPVARKRLANSIEMVIEKNNLIKSLEKKIESAKIGYSYRMQDITIFEGVLDFLSLTSLCQMTRVCKKFRTEEYARLIKKAQCKIIIQGLKEEDQYGFWDFYVNFEFMQRKYPLQYMMNAMKPSSYERDILSDIDRTYTFNELLNSRQSSLLKVLIAFSNAVPKIGYIQGLNSIAAVFLSHKVTESEAYWLMKYIFKKKRFDEVLTDEFSKVQLLTYQLEIYMRNYVPDIIDHLGENGMNISYFATQWFITMFAYDLELTHLTKIWNLFLIKGWKVLIRVALTILWHFQEEICNQSPDELPSFLKSFVREKIKEIPENELFGVALSFKVSNRLLKGLEILYEHSAPLNVLLVSNANNKLEWQIVSEECSSMDVGSAIHKNIMEYLNENIDQVRALSKAKSAHHHQHESQKLLHNEAANVSLALDDVSTEYGTSMKSLHNPATKFTDQTFIQTLSNFGQKLKQILTPKDHNQEPFFQGRKVSNAKPFDFTSEKETAESQAILTDRSASKSNGNHNSRNCKLVVANDAMDGTPFKKSIITTLKDRNNKLGINLFDPLTFNANKDRDNSSNLMSGHKSSTASIHEAVFHTERKMSTAEAKIAKHKRNSSFNQDTTHFMQRSQTLHLGQLLDKKNDEMGFAIRRNTDNKNQLKGLKTAYEPNQSLHLENLNRNNSLHNNALYLPSEPHMHHNDSGRKTYQRGYGLPLNIIKYSDRG